MIVERTYKKRGSPQIKKHFEREKVKWFSDAKSESNEEINGQERMNADYQGDVETKDRSKLIPLTRKDHLENNK